MGVLTWEVLPIYAALGSEIPDESPMSNEECDAALGKPMRTMCPLAEFLTGRWDEECRPKIAQCYPREAWEHLLIWPRGDCQGCGGAGNPSKAEDHEGWLPSIFHTVSHHTLSHFMCPGAPCDSYGV